MADTEDPVLSICHTCVTVLEKYGTTESVVPWLCSCTKQSDPIFNQKQFSAGRYVGTAFTDSWQGVPKGKKVLYRPSR